MFFVWLVSLKPSTMDFRKPESSKYNLPPEIKSFYHKLYRYTYLIIYAQ